MISYIKGILWYISEGSIIVETGGIGYKIVVPNSVVAKLPAMGQQVTIYIYMAVREDGIVLYGFLEPDDEQMFEKLITVNGIGPKGAVGILSVLTPDELRFAILSDDVKTISRAPGIGPKTAGRLVLELRDKVDLQESFDLMSSHVRGDLQGIPAGGIPGDVKNEAVQALVVLGYSQSEALKAVSSVAASEDTDVSGIIKLALKSL